MSAVSAKTAGNVSVRQVCAREQTAGLIACLGGVLLLAWGSGAVAAPAFATPAGLALIGAGWALFAYVLYQRARFARAQLQNGDR